jgi:hypothetical protein
MKIFTVTVSLFAVLFLSGCATMYNDGYGKSEPKPLNVATLLRFNDIPVPAGFMVFDKESFAFQNDSARVALLKYIGPKSQDQVVQFFKEQMPTYNWNPINIIEYERRILNYEKGTETCIVTIEPRGGKSIVIIAISPRSRPMKVETTTK